VGYALARLVSPVEPLFGPLPPAPEGPSAPAPIHPELLHLAGDPGWVPRGGATALLKKYEPFLPRPGGRIEAPVPETNLPAQLLLRSAGYRAVRVFRGFYSGEDAYLMERRLGG